MMESDTEKSIEDAFLQFCIITSKFIFKVFDAA